MWQSAEVRVASGYAATDEMRAALDGVHTVFLIPARESANRLAEHLSAVDAIVAAGAERRVYLSWRQPPADIRSRTMRRCLWSPATRSVRSVFADLPQEA
jgi:hypothetical protein